MTKKNETSENTAQCAIQNVSNSSLVMATYRFPNGNVATFGHDDQQIPELQGVYSDELKNKIKQRSDSRTSWNGF